MNKLEKMEKKIKMLEEEVEDLYSINKKLLKMYKAIQELQDQFDSPAMKFIYYLE
jgi:hypothetical protein